MEWTQLWAGVTFAAQNGDAEGLLTAAAAGGLHLPDIVPRPGGFSARCAAKGWATMANTTVAATKPAAMSTASTTFITVGSTVAA